MAFFDFKNKFVKIKDTYKLLGFTKTLKKVLTYTIKKIIYRKHIEILLEKDLHENMKLSLEYKLPEITSLERRHLGALEELNKRSDTNRKHLIRVFNDYIKNKSQCFILELKGNIIGYIWCVNNKCGIHSEIIDYKFYRNVLKLKDDEVYLFDALLDPQYRGHHNATEFFLKVFSALKKLGYNRAFGMVLTNNLPARWTYKILGWKDIKKIVERRFFKVFVFKNKKVFLDTLMP
jgi:hypothetical protein